MDVDYVGTLVYHCENCGANVNPKDYKCSYCDSYLGEITSLFGKRAFRVFCKTKNNRKIYLHEVESVGTIEEQPTLEIETENGIEFIKGRGCVSDNFEMSLVCTQKTIEKAEFIRDCGVKKVYVESDYIPDKCFGIDCSKMAIGSPNIKNANEIMTIPVVFTMEAFKFGDMEIYVNDGTTCPNCGSILRQKFGLCDYCGGWVNDLNVYY